MTRNHRLKQSVAQWCFSKLPLETLCKAAADLGIAGIDLLEEKFIGRRRRSTVSCAPWPMPMVARYRKA